MTIRGMMALLGHDVSHLPERVSFKKTPPTAPPLMVCHGVNPTPKEGT